MNRRQEQVVAAFQKLVHRARMCGLEVVVDSDAVALRLVPVANHTFESYGGDDPRRAAKCRVRWCGRPMSEHPPHCNDQDLREAGVKVRVHNACGSSYAKVSGGATNYGNL